MIFVQTEGWLMKVSPINMIGIKFTSTVALKGLIAVNGIRGKGGHQHVKFLITML